MSQIQSHRSILKALNEMTILYKNFKEEKQMAVITRREFVKMISRKLEFEYPQWDIYYIVQATFRCFEDILKNGDTLIVGDCFRMEPKLKKERQNYNFGKGKVTTPAHYEPYFKPYKKLTDACLSIPVNEKEKEENE